MLLQFDNPEIVKQCIDPRWLVEIEVKGTTHKASSAPKALELLLLRQFGITKGCVVCGSKATSARNHFQV